MENRISRNQLFAIKEAFARKFNHFENKDIHFEIYRMDDIFDEEVTFGINWAAIGTVSPEETVRFANSLIEVSKIVERVNSLNMIIDYKLEETLKTEEQYQNAVKEFTDKYLY